ncbi:MAG: hypothetical protein RLZZ618_3023 [Pseudomonadota bacterium]|jgi:vacuolar-type H+-ATPase subunit I/STV1
MKTSTLETLIWVLIYGGLLVVCLGVSIQRSWSSLGLGFMGVGAVVAVVGFALVYVRSRVKDE